MTDPAEQLPAPIEPLIVLGGTTSGDHCVRALDISNGAILWETIVPSGLNKSSMAVGSGLVVRVTSGAPSTASIMRRAEGCGHRTSSVARGATGTSRW